MKTTLTLVDMRDICDVAAPKSEFVGNVKADMLYAVIQQSPGGNHIGVVARGADINWRSGRIIGVVPLNLTCDVQARLRVVRSGRLKV